MIYILPFFSKSCQDLNPRTSNDWSIFSSLLLLNGFRVLLNRFTTSDFSLSEPIITDDVLDCLVLKY